MKLPRGVSADRLIRALERVGYEVVRQRGAMSGYGIQDLPATLLPFRCTIAEDGTLHGILADVALMRSITIESLCELL